MYIVHLVQYYIYTYVFTVLNSDDWPLAGMHFQVLTIQIWPWIWSILQRICNMIVELLGSNHHLFLGAFGMNIKDRSETTRSPFARPWQIPSPPWIPRHKPAMLGDQWPVTIPPIYGDDWGMLRSLRSRGFESSIGEAGRIRHKPHRVVC